MLFALYGVPVVFGLVACDVTSSDGLWPPPTLYNLLLKVAVANCFSRHL